jgi:hypothetical protein
VVKVLTEGKASENVISTLAEKEGVVAALGWDSRSKAGLKAGELLHKLQGALLPSSRRSSRRLCRGCSARR